MNDFLKRLTNHKSVFFAMMRLPDFRKNAFDLVVASALINLLTLVLPLIIMQIYDRILPYQAVGSLTWLMLGCAAAVIIEATLTQTRSLIGAWWGARLEYLTSTAGMKRILNSRISDFENVELGTHLDRMNSISSLSALFTGMLFQMILDLPFAYMILWIIWVIGKNLVWIPLLLILVYLIIIVVSNRYFAKAKESQIECDEKRNSFYIEIFTGIQAIKSIGLEEKILRKTEELHAVNTATEKRFYFWNRLPTTAGLVISQVALYSIIIFGAMQLIQGEITLGIMSACSILVRRSMQPFILLAGTWLQLSNAKIALNKMKQLSDLEPDHPEETPSLPEDIDGAVVFKGVSLQDPNSGEWILKKTSFQIRPKEYVTITGSNENHTTALIMLMLGNMKPAEGNIYIDNYDVERCKPYESDGKIAYIPAKSRVFTGTILENITVFDESKEAEAISTATLLGLDRDVAQQPAGFHTPLTALSNEILPASMIHKIAIARAFIVHPRIIVFDRIDHAMDSETEKLFQRLLSKCVGQITVMQITENSNYLKHSHRTLTLSGDGRLTQSENNGAL